MALKTIRFIDDTIDRILRIIFIVIFLIGFYYTYDSLYVYREAANDMSLRFKPTAEQSPEQMLELSDDVVAWITIDDTKIDYPIMQGETNDTYLNKGPDGKYSMAGSIFLDVRNKADFTDPYSLIYGHHMAHGLMFGSLDAFLEEDYYRQHQTGTLTTVTGDVYDIHIFCATEAQTIVEEIFEVTEKDGLIDYLRANGMFYDEPDQEGWEKQVIGLSTCKTPDSIDRTLVFGWLSPSTKEGYSSDEFTEHQD